MLTAGLMLFPGPAMATAFSVPSARLGARVGYRIPGCSARCCSSPDRSGTSRRPGDTPAYLSEYLPGIAISGAGVGLVIPTLTGAGASSLAPERFATGAAVLTMGRQIGAALGVAVLVAVLGTTTGTAADFHTAWLISVVGGVTTAWRSPRSGRRCAASRSATLAAEGAAVEEPPLVMESAA